MLRWSLRRLGSSDLARELIPRIPVTRAMSRRFVAGEFLDDFVAAAREARRQGLEVTGNYLGEAITDPERAGAAAEVYTGLLDRIRREGLGRVGSGWTGSGRTGTGVNISVKPSQMGMAVSREALFANVEVLLREAREAGVFVRFDMESSAYTERTLDMFQALWLEGHRGIGVVLQACLKRSAEDLRSLIQLGASVRLCKGAYAESGEVAYQGAGRIRESFRALMRTLIEGGRGAAIATHDEGLIRDTLRHANAEGIDSSAFEFQLLYGVRRDLQRKLVKRGYRVRVYIPFGMNWYPYLMRRLSERPGTVLFVAGSVLKESPLGALFPGRSALEGKEE